MDRAVFALPSCIDRYTRLYGSSHVIQHLCWEKEHQTMLHRSHPFAWVKGTSIRTTSKQSLPFLLALLIAFSFVFAACGGSSSTSSSGPVTLTYGWWSNTPAKDDSMKAWISNFESTHPNIKIKPEIIPWGNYWDKLKTTTAGGNAYDIVGLCSCNAAPYFDSGSGCCE